MRLSELHFPPYLHAAPPLPDALKVSIRHSFNRFSIEGTFNHNNTFLKKTLLCLFNLKKASSFEQLYLIITIAVFTDLSAANSLEFANSIIYARKLNNNSSYTSIN